jgi:hypothetical protein
MKRGLYWSWHNVLMTFQQLLCNKKSMMRKTIDSLRRTRKLAQVLTNWIFVQLSCSVNSGSSCNFIFQKSTQTGLRCSYRLKILQNVTPSFFGDHTSQFARFVSTRTSSWGLYGLKIQQNVTPSFFGDCPSQFMRFELTRTGSWGLYGLKIQQNVTPSFFGDVQASLWRSCQQELVHEICMALKFNKKLLLVFWWSCEPVCEVHVDTKWLMVFMFACAQKVAKCYS